jgi:hypothetical protein
MASWIAMPVSSERVKPKQNVSTPSGTKASVSIARPPSRSVRMPPTMFATTYPA